jgi:hypothetical protein
MEVSGQLHSPAALLQVKSTRYPLNGRLGGPQSREFCEFCRHNTLFCFSTNVYCCCLFRYGLSPETYEYILVYEWNLNINRTIYKHLLITFFPQKVIPIFLHILPTHLYNFAITWAPSLCLFQKEFVVAHPAIIAQKVLTSSSASPNRWKSPDARSGL